MIGQVIALLSLLHPHPAQYKVCWQSSVTGSYGCGSSTTKESARQWADFGNKNYPELKHWIAASKGSK